MSLRFPRIRRATRTDQVALLGYIDGLQMSQVFTDLDHDIELSPGQACLTNSIGEAVMVSYSGSIEKGIDATWTAGSGGGKSSLGATGIDEWLDVFLMSDRRGTQVDIGFEEIGTGPSTLVSDSGLEFTRRIGSVFTDGSANVIPFIQKGDMFYWDTPRLDVEETPSGTNTLITKVLSVPTGVNVHAQVEVQYDSGAATKFYLHPPFVADINAGSLGSTPVEMPYTAGRSGGNEPVSTVMFIMTDTSGQVSYTATNNPADGVGIMTLGWIDPRGRRWA